MAQAPEGVETAGVVHDGQAKAASDGAGKGHEDLGHHVLGGNEIDVVAPLRLEIEHHSSELLGPHLTPRLLLADVVALAKNAAKVALGKENGPAAAPAPEAVLLPVVGKVARHAGVAPGSAHPQLSLQAIVPAFPGTHPAFPETRKGLFHAPLQLARLQKPEREPGGRMFGMDIAEGRTMELIRVGLIFAVWAILGLLIRALDKSGDGSRTEGAAATRRDRAGSGDYGFLIGTISPL